MKYSLSSIYRDGILNNNRYKSIAEVMKQVKGATSFHINKKEIIDQPFKWQVGYGAFSISDSAVPRVTKYIANQKSHHAT
jgi:hypothetical protein